ncbi:copper chaperone PCu(A)C [Marivibrio halodurans]|uniref:Copper chaperone PCu(A)C n=1 Tax=Marivibrio halodurans TaxID=2039722 RepID=A0A8J7RVM2_9PROT|nr:copper chaperone PCu(A)C [Marivibrio halodurans]MBP5855380.1 copper chaperone PCu(A)C [Marivibrio halodurans]
MRRSSIPANGHRAGGCLRPLFLGAALALGPLFAMTAAHAGEARTDGLHLSDGWIRMIIPARPAAGYFTLHNDGTRGRALVAASSPACGRMMLHRTGDGNGADRMVPIARVDVPAGGTVRFAPHGHHLMCMAPDDGMMKVGGTVPVTLRFSDGADLTARFTVRGAGG